MEGINIKSDIKLFIDLTVGDKPTTSLSYIPLEFQDYSSSSPSDAYTSLIASLTLQAWNGETLSSDDYMTFNSFISSASGRKAFVSGCLSKKEQGTFFIPPEGFSQIGVLTMSILTECERFSDFDTARQCLAISKMFHKEESDREKPREYIVKLVDQHRIWKNMEFWEHVIEKSILDDLRQKDEYGQYEYYGSEERVFNVVFCQLGANIQVMLGFNIDTQAILELIDGISSKYALPRQDVDTLMVRVYKGHDFTC